MNRAQVLLLIMIGVLGVVLALVAAWRESRARRVTQARLKVLRDARLEAQKNLVDTGEGVGEGRIALFALRAGLSPRLLVPGVPFFLLAVGAVAASMLA